MLKPTTAQSGFSLLELLITVTIMVIIVGGSVAGFMTFQARQEVLTTAKNVQQLVRTAQGKARVRETPTSATLTAAGFGAGTCNSDNSRLQGYRINLSSNVITLVALCGEDDLDPLQATAVVYSETITGMTYSGPDYIDFWTLYRGLRFSGGPSPATIRFTSVSDVNNTSYFTVENGGAITEVLSGP